VWLIEYSQRPSNTEGIAHARCRPRRIVAVVRRDNRAVHQSHRSGYSEGMSEVFSGSSEVPADVFRVWGCHLGPQ